MIYNFKVFKELVWVALIGFSCTSNPSHPPQKAQNPLSGIHQTNYDLKKLEEALDQLVKDPVLRHGMLGFSLKNAQTGALVLEHQPQQSLIVASCIKAVTTATALGILGAEYTFKTTLEYSGNIEKGILKGDIFIRGGGDPTLASQILKIDNLPTLLNQWVTAIKNKGIQQIEGNIVADEEAYATDLPPAEWIWGDMGNYFGAPAGALNVLDNTYRLFIQPGKKIGDPTSIVRTEPNIPHIQFINTVKTAEVGSGDQAVISGAPYESLRYVTGTIPLGGVFSIKGSIPDPGLYLAQSLRAKLDQAGIQVIAKSTSTRLLKLAGEKYASERQTLTQQKSPSLKTIIDYTNRFSVNLYAEALLKAIGMQQKGEASTQAGLEAVVEYWEKKGLNTEGLFLKDGSGLARANGITADQLSQMMHLITQESYFQDFYSSLPVAGISGTMYSVGGGTAMQNNLRAKSGAMSRVLGYVGYFKTQSGTFMCFSVIVNNYTCEYPEIKKRLSDLMLEMVGI